mgnify:CR=1 FL=1
MNDTNDDDPKALRQLGQGHEGAADLGVGTGSVSLTGRVYAPAVLQVNTPTVDFGIVHRGDVVAALNISIHASRMSMEQLVEHALPPLLPWSYTDLDYYSLQQPPSPSHWFGTNALGQDLFAMTLRGMQKSMLIGLCVALISTAIAATVGSVALK